MNMTLGPPHSTGAEPLAEAITQRRIEQARAAGWPQLALADLAFGRWVEHTPTGRLYCLRRGETDAAVYAGATAFYLNDQGAIRFLEAPPSNQPQSRGELVQRQAEREQRRNTPKPRPVRRRR